MEIKKTQCGICVISCGLNAYIDNGKLIKVEGAKDCPINRGHICPKAEAATEIVYHPDRLKYPIKRDGLARKRISWDEALDTITEKLNTVKDKFGAKSVVIHTGSGLSLNGSNAVARRFSFLYGTPNYAGNGSYCAAPRDLGVLYTYGIGKNRLPPDFRNSRCIMMWGANVCSSYPPRAQDVAYAKEQGAKVIVIDPRLTKSGELASIHVQIRPGTDGALALGMLNVILTEGLYNKEFVEKWTVGFEELVEFVKEYPPEKVERITWVPAEIVEEIARSYATIKPACTLLGHGLDLHTNAVQNVRAIALLPAVTGNIDIPGGNVRRGGAFELYRTASLNDITLYDKLPPGQQSVGEKYPLFLAPKREIKLLDLPDQILTEKPYPIKVLIINGGNPMTQWPNTSKVKRALEKLELLVVMDIFMTQTAKLAHIVLPAASCFEKTELRMGLSLMKKVIEPLYECKSDYEFWVELARKMGYEKYFPWKTVEEYNELHLESTGITLQALEQGVVPLKHDTIEFGTPSGKIEIYSETFFKNGHDPLAAFNEPKPGINKEVLVKEYPLTLIAGGRMLEYIHSRYRSVPSLQKRVPEPYIEINSETAESLGITGSKKVLVETSKGKILITPKITEKIHPKVVFIPDSGDDDSWAGAGVNYLTEDEVSDPISGDPPLHSMCCKVSAVATSN